MDICRVCLHTNKEMVQLFTSDTQDDFVSKIHFCTGILFTKGDNSPCKICKKCIEDMYTAYKFKTNCIRSDSMFKKIILKVEPPITIDDDSKMVDEFKEDIIKVSKNKEEALLDDNRDVIDDDDFTWNCDITLKVKSEETEPPTKSNRSKEDLKTGMSIWRGNEEPPQDFLEILYNKEEVEDDTFSDDEDDEVESLPNSIVAPSYSPITSPERRAEREMLVEMDEQAPQPSTSRDRSRSPINTSSESTNEDERKLRKGGATQLHPCRKNGPKRKKMFKFKRLTCEICDIKFSDKKESDDHKKKFHSSSEKWICEICGKMIAPSSLHYHIRSHMPPRFECASCDYKCSHKYDLVKHVRIHTGSKSYICPVCAQLYRTSSNLHAHVRLAHERVRRFECPTCSRTFYDRTKLNRHIDSHNDVKRYSCDVCHSCFTRRCYWKKHLLRHHGIAIPAVRPGRQRRQLQDLHLLEAGQKAS